MGDLVNNADKYRHDLEAANEEYGQDKLVQNILAVKNQLSSKNFRS